MVEDEGDKWKDGEEDDEDTGISSVELGDEDEEEGGDVDEKDDGIGVV